MFTVHLRINETPSFFVIANKRNLFFKAAWFVTAFPMLVFWSITGLMNAALWLAAISAVMLFVTGAHREFLIGLTDQRLLIIALGDFKRQQNIKSIELFEISSFDSVTVLNSFWVIGLLDGSKLKFSVDRKEDRNTDQQENSDKLEGFLQGLNKVAHPIVK